MRMSARGDVDPFIVMDVMEAARAEEARGRRIVHMEVGQPGTPAPGARAGAGRAMAAGPLGYTVALGLPELRARIARLYRDWYGVDLDPAGWSSPPAPRPPSSSPSPPLRARREGRDRRARLPDLPQHPARARPRARRHRHRPRGPLPADAARPRRPTSPGCWWRARPTRPAPCSPPPSSPRSSSAARGPRPRLRLRRDLPRHPVRRPRRLGARDHGRGLRHQLVLEVLLDDRLADRLDGGARGACPPHRAAGAELLHLRAARQPGRGAGRARRDARARRATSRSTAPTARSARRPAEGRLHPHRAPGRRLLHLRRRCAR